MRCRRAQGTSVYQGRPEVFGAGQSEAFDPLAEVEHLICCDAQQLPFSVVASRHWVLETAHEAPRIRNAGWRRGRMATRGARAVQARGRWRARQWFCSIKRDLD